MGRQVPIAAPTEENAMTTVPTPAQQTSSYTPATQPDARIRAAAAIGLAGSALSAVDWVLMLGNPAEATGLWYLGGAIGQVAMIAMTVLVLGMFAARETGAGATGRGFLALWALGLAILLVGGVQSLIAGNQDTILFPIGGITATLAALVSSIFIACNERLAATPRRWAPLAYAVGTIATSFFQGNEHTLRVNVADLVNVLLTLLLAGAFFAGVQASSREPR
jgi:hypothetical protein